MGAAEARELPGSVAAARLVSPLDKGTAVRRGFAFEEVLAHLQRRELGLAFSLGALPPLHVVFL